MLLRRSGKNIEMRLIDWERFRGIFKRVKSKKGLWERERVCACVCDRQVQKERESVCVWERECVWERYIKIYMYTWSCLFSISKSRCRSSETTRISIWFSLSHSLPHWPSSSPLPLSIFECSSPISAHTLSACFSLWSGVWIIVSLSASVFSCKCSFASWLKDEK